MSSNDAAPWTDGRCLTPDGVAIAYREYDGHGPDVVLLPGIGANLEAEHETALGLAESYRVISIEPRGIGQSGESETITSSDFVVDVETVVATLGRQPLAVVGHSMGGVIAGLYGTLHPGVRVVSIDGFGGGVASVGTVEDREALRSFLASARAGLEAMTAAPDEGDDDWRAEQIQVISRTLDRMGYVCAHRDAMVARQFVPIGAGRWRRHPSRKLVDEAARAAFGIEPPANILQMFHRCTGPVLILRCTESGWPAVLDAELDSLAVTHPNVTVQRLPLTHTGPVLEGVAMTVATVTAFLLPGQSTEEPVSRNP